MRSWPLRTTMTSWVPGAWASEACVDRASRRSSYSSTSGEVPAGASGRLSNLPSAARRSCASLRRRTTAPERGAPMSSEIGTPRPTAIFHRTPTVGLLLHVSICESAARLTPDARARSSSERPRPFRLWRKFSATRRPSWAAPTSSPATTVGRFDLRAANAFCSMRLSNLLDQSSSPTWDGYTGHRRANPQPYQEKWPRRGGSHPPCYTGPPPRPNGSDALPVETTRRALAHLQTLEAESIHILREAVAEFENPVMMYSIG